MTLTPESLAELRRLLERSSVDWVHGGRQYITGITRKGFPRCVATFPAGGGEWVGPRDKDQALADAALVAAMRNALPDLLDIAERVCPACGGHGHRKVDGCRACVDSGWKRAE